MIDRKSSPQLRWSDAAAYWAGFVGEHYTHLPFFGGLRSAVEKSLLERNLPEAGLIPIPKIDASQTTPEQFRRDYVQRYVPVVIKGVANSWPALQNWTPDFFQAKYGSEKVCVRVKSAGVGAESVYVRDVALTELVENVLSNGEYYANNLEDLFNHNPELRSDLRLRELEAYSRIDQPQSVPSEKKRWSFPKWGEILSTQLFLSNAKGRTGYHCASGGNFFLQIYGKKRWLFVNPRHTPFIYPIIRKDFIYSSSAVDSRMSRDELFKAGYGLYNFIPKYEVVLEPGDILYSPQWWWHTVDNLSTSIGVAMRFRTGSFAGNPVYSAMTMLSPALWRHFYGVIRTGWGADATGARTFFEPEGGSLKVRLRPPIPLASKK